MDDRYRVELVELADRTECWVKGRRGWVEPTCPECGEPIRWILDMHSYKYEHGEYVMCHARCVWLPEAFTRERKVAKRQQAR